MKILNKEILEGIDLDLCQLMLDNVGAYVFVKDINKKYLYANQLVHELFAEYFDTIIGLTDDKLFDFTVSSDIKCNDDKVLKFGAHIKETEVNVLKATGEKRVYLSVKKPIYNVDHEIIGLLGVSTDITEQHKIQQELHVQASIDHLTGLYNRRFFFELAEKSFSESVRHQRSLSLIMIDIDFFKKINDIYGHPVGDVIIKFVAAKASSLLRKEDAIARIGGEEFAILLPSTDIDAAKLIAQKIQNTIASSSIEGDWEGVIEPKVSVGVSTMLLVDKEFYSLYKRADKGLYQAKESGRDKVCVCK